MSTVTRGAGPGASRLRTRLLGGGTEPDPRFTLANERTFLAWIRTALALIAGAVVIETVLVDAWPVGARRAVVVLLLVVGAVLGAGSAVRWLSVERALRSGRPLPLSPLVPLLAAVVLVGAVGVLGATVWQAG